MLILHCWNENARTLPKNPVPGPQDFPPRWSYSGLMEKLIT